MISNRLILLFILCLPGYLFAGTNDFYRFKWLDPKKKVFVLQSKIHENKKTWYFNIGGGKSELSDFQDTVTGYTTVGYYFKEQWAAEFFYNYYSNSNNDSYDAIQGQTATIPHVVRYGSIYGLNLIFSPFYGKINTFNTIYYIDWSFGFGLGMVDSEDNTRSFDAAGNTPDIFEQKSRMAISLKSQVKWHLTERFKLMFDFLNYYTSLPKPATAGGGEKYTRSYDFVFSVGFKF